MKTRLLLAALALSVHLARAQAPAPALTALSPNTAQVGDAGVTIMVFGSNFLPGATVTWNGTPLATSFIAVSQLSATVPQALLITQGFAVISAVNPSGARSNSLLFTVAGRPLTISTASLPAATAGVPYTYALTASGGSPDYTWQLVDALPAGMVLSAEGIVSGTPPVAGTFNFTVRITDRVQASTTKTLSLAVAPPPVSITTASTLPAARLGVAYQQALAVTGGNAPYRWSAGSGLPPGIGVNASTGVLAGTPQATGNFSFAVEAADRGGFTASKRFTLAVKPPPLAITTEAPLFPGTLGQAYSQTFSASGGTPPYRWSLVSGSLDGLALDAASGNLGGTPAATGTYPFSIQVTGRDGEVVNRSYVLLINSPSLTIITNSALPAGIVGADYSYKLGVAGGTAPYSWSMVAGWLPGLRIEAGGTIAGTPAEAGSFTMVAEARDSAGLTATKTFGITVEGARLSLAAPPELAAGKVGEAWSYQPRASGGVAPYAWSANGLPPGLEIDGATGFIGGTPTAPGPFVFNVRVVDAARTVAIALYRVSFELPPLPALAIRGLPGAVEPAQHHAVGLELESAFPVSLAGQLLLSFAPESGAGDGMVRFSSGSRTAAFRIPAGATSAEFDDGDMAVQTGTVAGSIVLSVRLEAGGVEVTPAPTPSVSARMDRAAPVIVSAKLVRKSGGFDIQVTGYSTARELTEAVFQFSAASGSTLQQAQVRVPMDAVASAWFQDAASVRFGSQFTFTQSFTVQQGEASAVTPVSVTVTNRVGSATAQIVE